MAIAAIAALTWALGGAINALADSLPHDRIPGPPACLHCGAPRPRVAWLAILALITGKARCPYCGAGRGVRPIVVEGGFVLFVLWLYARNASLAVFLPGVIVGWVFLLIAVIDWEHRLILQAVVLPAGVLLALVGILQPGRGPAKTLLGGLAGFVILWGMYGLGILISRWLAHRRGEPLNEVAFGFGDVLLGALIGIVVGWPGVIIAVVIGVLAAGVFSLVLVGAMLIRRRYTPYTAIPYGPFLLIGASVVYYGGRTALEALLAA